MDLSVIIVSYNSSKELPACLRSIANSRTRFKFEVMVHDNNSPDKTAELVKNEFINDAHPWLRWIEGENMGFSGGNNVGIKQAGGRYILLLNPDTEVEPDTFETMVDFMDQRPDVGIGTGKVVLGNGNLDPACRRSFPTPWVAITRLLGLSFLFPKSKLFNRYNMGWLSEDEEYEIDCCTGAFLLIRKEVIDKIGLMDDAIFMYNEDVDWCYRTKQAGWKVYYYPKTKIIHHKGHSAKFSPLALWWFHYSMIYFYKKHFAKQYPWLFNQIMYAGIWARYFVKARGRIYRPKPKNS